MKDKFKALGHEVRLSIYRALRVEKLCVCEITELLDMSQPAVSQHLSQLKNAGLIESERQGQWTFYYPSESSFRETIDDLFDAPDKDILDELQSIKEQNLCDLRNDSGDVPSNGETE